TVAHADSHGTENRTAVIGQGRGLVMTGSAGKPVPLQAGPDSIVGAVAPVAVPDIVVAHWHDFHGDLLIYSFLVTVRITEICCRNVTAGKLLGEDWGEALAAKLMIEWLRTAVVTEKKGCPRNT